MHHEAKDTSRVALACSRHSGTPASSNTLQLEQANDAAYACPIRSRRTHHFLPLIIHGLLWDARLHFTVCAATPQVRVHISRSGSRRLELASGAGWASIRNVPPPCVPAISTNIGLSARPRV